MRQRNKERQRKIKTKKGKTYISSQDRAKRGKQKEGDKEINREINKNVDREKGRRRRKIGRQRRKKIKEKKKHTFQAILLVSDVLPFSLSSNDDV